MSEAFWETKTLAELSEEEWESLCDGCGLCCLQKLEDEDGGAVFYTRVACKLLDLQTCRCSNYPQRKEFVPDCVKLTAADVGQFKWLPPSCAYRLRSEGKHLYAWHHLISGDRQTVHQARISRAGRMLAENSIASDRWQDQIIFRCG